MENMKKQFGQWGVIVGLPLFGLLIAYGYNASHGVTAFFLGIVELVMLIVMFLLPAAYFAKKAEIDRDIVKNWNTKREGKVLDELTENVDRGKLFFGAHVMFDLFIVWLAFAVGYFIFGLAMLAWVAMIITAHLFVVAHAEKYVADHRNESETSED